MSNITKLISILIFICLAISGCKKSSIDISDSQSSSRTPMPPEQLWADYSANLNTNALNLDGNETHVTAEITANCVIDTHKTRTIKFDLDIPETPDFTAYEYKFYKGGEFDIEDIMSIFFGEEHMKNIKPFDDDPNCYGGVDINDNSIASYYKGTAELYINKGNAQSWNIFDENKLILCKS